MFFYRKNVEECICSYHRVSAVLVDQIPIDTNNKQQTHQNIYKSVSSLKTLIEKEVKQSIVFGEKRPAHSPP